MNGLTLYSGAVWHMQGWCEHLRQPITQLVIPYLAEICEIRCREPARSTVHPLIEVIVSQRGRRAGISSLTPVRLPEFALVDKAGLSEEGSRHP